MVKFKSLLTCEHLWNTKYEWNTQCLYPYSRNTCRIQVEYIWNRSGIQN